MSAVRWMLAFGLAGCLAAAQAQSTSRPSAGAASSARATDATSMERARRAAANPLRMILQAGRGKRRDAELAEAPASTRDATGVTAVHGDSAAPAATAVGDTLEGAFDSGIVVIAQFPPVLPFASPGLGEAFGPTVARVGPPVEVSELGAPPAPGRLQTAAEFDPQPVVRVDPRMPPHLLDQMPVPEVSAVLTIRRDGSVAEVQVQPPAPAALHPYVTEALLQWRFEPQPLARRHRVTIPFVWTR